MSYRKQEVPALYRLLRLLYWLNQGTVNLRNWQVEHGISERTSQRDIQKLQLAGFDIEIVSPGVYALTGAMRFMNAEGTYGEKYKN